MAAIRLSRELKGKERQHQPKTNLIVAVLAIVVVAVRGAAVLSIVVPTAAAINAIRTL